MYLRNVTSGGESDDWQDRLELIAKKYGFCKRRVGLHENMLIQFLQLFE